MEKIYDDGVKKLEGQAVLEILFGSNEDAGGDFLTFKTAETEFHYYFDGDCCSQSSVTEILGVEEFIDKGTVSSVEESDYGPHADGEYGDCISRHGLRLRCKESDSYRHPAELLILWENSSNGYYDGSIDSIAKIPDEVKMESIKKNWKKKAEDAK